MANIPVVKLKDDVLDRLSNLSAAQQVSDGIKTKLQSDARVAQALNQALILFVREANLSAISAFTEVIEPPTDTDVGGGDGISNNVKTYKFPDETFAERQNMGLAKIILNGDEESVEPGAVSPLGSVRHVANSKIYSTKYSVYNIDYEHKRLYVPKDATLKVRYVKYPEKINEDWTYSSTNEVDIPIRDDFLQDIASTALRELLKMATGIGNEPAEPQTEEEQS